MVNRKPGAILAVVLIVFALAAIASQFDPVRAATLRQLAVSDSYIIVNLDALDQAATHYFYKPTTGWSALRYHKDLGYFELSTDEGSTWNRVTTEDIDTDTSDHGELSGLADDDHEQYHTDARGDARYYTETELDAGQLDDRYYREDEHLDSSAGAGDAGKPIKLDADGHVDASMVNDADISHLNIADIGTNAHSVVDTHLADTTDPHSTVSDADPPTATEAFSGEHVFDYLEFFNGSIFETIDVVITESGGTVSLELQAEGGGDLTLNFSDGHHAFDATDPVASVALTNGDDEVPVKNWVYILQSNDTLTASAVGWPDAEHAPIATVVVQSAASVASTGPYAVQSWVDHIKDANDQGHLTDIADWIRGQHATWKSGVEPTLTITEIGGSDTVIFTSTAGEVYQLHPHDFPAFTGTPTIYVYNDNATPYNPITDLNQLTAISDGTAFSTNDYFTVTIWGVVSEDAADCKLYLNLPSGVYGNSTAALLDSSMFTNTSIPAIYKGSAFLIKWYTFRYQTIDGGTFTLVAGGDVDLRGQPPGTSTGGGAGGGSSLTIEEQDSFPSVPDVNTIKFPNGSVSDDGGGIVSVSISATDSAAIHDNIAGEIAAIAEKGSPVSADLIIIEDSADSNNKKRVQIGNLAGSGDMTKAVYDTDTNDIVDKAEAVPHVTSGDVTVAEGQIIQKSHEDALAVNGGGTGEVQGEALMSFLAEWTFNLVNPKALWDIDTKWLITILGDKLPHGMIIVEMKCQADADPTTEMVIDFMFATNGDFIGLTGATVIIAIDSTAGEFSEDTNANFNGGSPIPAGAVIYVLLKDAPDVLTTQYGCTVTSYNPED